MGSSRGSGAEAAAEDPKTNRATRRRLVRIDVSVDVNQFIACKSAWCAGRIGMLGMRRAEFFTARSA
jgi:hypothetical protein